jgi:uridine kinase
MKKPYVITINAVSGGGKTALAKIVQESLPSSMLFGFDDFDTNIIPDDLYEWYMEGANPLEIDCPGMGDAVEHVIEQGSLKYIVLDCPLGRNHPRFSKIIDLSVFIDTPLDIAMARRILRDYAISSGESAEKILIQLRGEMSHYLEKARYPFLEACKLKDTSDLVLDGWSTLEDMRDKVLERIMAGNQDPKDDMV